MTHRKTVTRRVFLTGSGAVAGAVYAGGGVASSVNSPSQHDPAAGEFFAAPTPASTEIVLDNPHRAKLATEGTVLAGPIEANQTTFDVLTSTGAPWTTSSTEFTTVAGD